MLRCLILKPVEKYLKEYRDIISVVAFLGLLFISLNVVLPAYMDTPTPLAYISSGSMEPTYYTGDLVIIKGVKGSDINVGDVIVFKPSGFSEYILHRVAAKKFENGKWYFLTKGDNPNTNLYVDTAWGWIPEDNVYGKVIYRVPYLGYLFMFLSSLLGKLFIILLAILILLTDFGDSEQTSIDVLGFIREHKKHFLGILLIILVSSSLIIVFSDYVYIGSEKPDVEVISVGPPIDRYSMKIYPVFLKIKSYGLNKGTIREITIIPVRKTDNYTSWVTKWNILYVFIGEKTVCLNLFIPESDVIINYRLFVSFKVEYFWGHIVSINKTLEISYY